MNADADDVAGLDERGIERIERLVRDKGIAPLERCGCGQYIQPAWRDHGHAEGNVARIDEMDAHEGSLSLMRKS